MRRKGQFRSNREKKKGRGKTFRNREEKEKDRWREAEKGRKLGGKTVVT